MDYSNIIKLLGELVGALIAGALLYVIPFAKKWLQNSICLKESQAVEKLVYNLVESAEQQFKANDPTGTIRKKYVEDTLIELGYELTNHLVAIIEASVYEINGERE